MSDLFHAGVPDGYVEAVSRVMTIVDWHTYEVLTKRAERLRALLNGKLRFAPVSEKHLVGSQCGGSQARIAESRAFAASAREGTLFVR